MKRSLLCVVLFLASPVGAANRLDFVQFPNFSKIAVLVDTRFTSINGMQISYLEKLVFPDVTGIYTLPPMLTPWFSLEPPKKIDDLELPRSLEITDNQAFTREGAKHMHNLLKQLDNLFPNQQQETLPVVIANMGLFDGFQFLWRNRYATGYAVDLGEVRRIEKKTGLVLPRRTAVILANNPLNPIYENPKKAATLLAHEIGHLTGLDNTHDKKNLMYSHDDGLSNNLTRAQIRLIRRWLRFHGRR